MSSLIQLHDDDSTKQKQNKQTPKKRKFKSVATSDAVSIDNNPSSLTFNNDEIKTKINSDVITFTDESYKTPPQKSEPENINNNRLLTTTSSATSTSINNTIKIESMTYQSEKNCDLDSLFDSFKQNSTNCNTKSTNLTVVDVCKIYTIEEEKNILVAIAISNFYGGRNYIKDFINKPSKLFYFAYATQLCENKLNIREKSHVDYLFHKNSRPVTVLSSYPRTENKYLFETMEETLKKLILQFDGKPDPENTGKIYSFQFLPDFKLDNKEKKLSFLYISSLISLPDRLTAAHQVVMEHLH